ncbi:MAG: hypothetical protein RMJ31_06340 [Nitrososphaerota archaeon]|nr:hypothetical protein [Nitrososphaerales archaeon]MDW8045372.1 hypothetical protein [Nitrososphaerota archaeon]
MDRLISIDDLGKFLYCSNLLEEKVAKAYEHIAKSIGDRIVSHLLVFIAHDSFKHAECFKMIGKWLNLSFEAGDCGKVWGEAWKIITVDAEKFMNRREISSEELIQLIDRLMNLENFAAEEYLTILHARLIKSIAEEKKVDLGHFKLFLEWIVEDEKKHTQILEIIKDLLSKEK